MDDRDGPVTTHSKTHAHRPASATRVQARRNKREGMYCELRTVRLPKGARLAAAVEEEHCGRDVRGELYV
jgi:hypothetical protein